MPELQTTEKNDADRTLNNAGAADRTDSEKVQLVSQGSNKSLVLTCSRKLDSSGPQEATAVPQS